MHLLALGCFVVTMYTVHVQVREASRVLEPKQIEVGASYIPYQGYGYYYSTSHGITWMKLPTL